MTTTPHPAVNVSPQVARFATAGMFLEALAVRDFASLTQLCTPDVRLQALVPKGLLEWSGSDEFSAAFERWFGDIQDFQLVDAGIGDVAGTVHMQWRARLTASRIGEGWFAVEQRVYADADDTGRFSRLRLLCSGYRREQARPPLDCTVPRTQSARCGLDQPQ
jgi:hypothetical protein